MMMFLTAAKIYINRYKPKDALSHISEENPEVAIASRDEGGPATSLIVSTLFLFSHFRNPHIQAFSRFLPLKKPCKSVLIRAKNALYFGSITGFLLLFCHRLAHSRRKIRYFSASVRLVLS